MSEEAPLHDTILMGTNLYTPKEFEKEKDLSNAVTSLSDFVYGKDSIYFDLEKRIKSSGKRFRVTDGLLLDLSKKPYQFWIVEYELGSHAVYGHVQPQIMSFMRSLRNPSTLRDIQLEIYQEIQSDKMKERRLKAKIGDEDTYYFLDQVLHKKAGVLVVIDELTSQL